MMRGLRRGTLSFGALLGAVAACGLVPATASAACAPGSLVPVQRDATVTQGLNSYSVLARGKETLVRLYLSLPSCAATTDAITITGASLDVTVNGATTTVQATPAIAQPFPQITNAFTATPLVALAPSDPVFVVPGSVLAPASTTDRFTATFTPSVSISGASAPVVLPAITKTVERRTNALRILVVPLAAPLDVSSTQNIQNAMTTLSRLYPVEDGTVPAGSPAGARLGSLTGTDGGIRWSLNTGAVDLGALGITLPFCGTSANFALIKAQLAQFRTSWNAANPNAQADKVLGTINEAISTASQGSTCAEGMASVTSPEAWVRASAIGGATAGMELSHTFGLVPSTRSNGAYHSLHKQADWGATDLHKAYNVTTRQYLPDARSAMAFSPPGWTNDTTLLEPLDWTNVLCQLSGPAGGGCAAPGTVGTSTGVAATVPDLAFNLNAVTDGTVAGTKVVESFVAHTYPTPPGDPSSTYSLAQYSAGGTLLRSDPVTPSTLETTHAGADNDAVDSAATTLISVSIPLATATADVRLLKGTTVLYDANSTGDPVVSDASVVSAGGITVAPGGTKSFERSVPTAAIPAKPDVYFLADTTGSMGAALQNVKDNIDSITDTVRAGSTDARFGAGNYRDFPAGDAFTNNASVTDTPTADDPNLALATKTAVGNWLAGGGGDTPEAQLYALHRTAQAGFFRSGTTKIVVWFGDNPGHDPICSGYGGLTSNLGEGDVLAELKAAKIRVIAVTVNSGEGSLGLNGDPQNFGFASDYSCAGAGSPGQADRITAGTGGILESAASPEAVSSAILAGLQNLPVTVLPHQSCDGGGGISVTFDPESRSVTSGTAAGFTETVHANDAAPGLHSCQVYYTVGDSADHVDAHTLSVVVSSLTGPHDLVTWTVGGAPAAKLKVDVVLDCSGVRNVIAVALTGNSFDAPAAPCAGGTYEVLANDGFTQTPPTTAGSVGGTTASPPPVAAIASPAAGTTVSEHSLVALHGSGYDAVRNAPVPPDGLHWFVDGAPAGTGPSVDLPGLAAGTHALKLQVTDSTGATDSQTISITSSADKDGDGIPVDQENRIYACAPAGSPPPDSDPTNGALDYDHDGIVNRDDLTTPNGPCVAETLYQARGVFLPNPLNLNGTESTVSAGGVLLRERDLRQVQASTVKIVSVNDIPVPGGIRATVWGALNQVGAGIFPKAPLVAFLRAHGIGGGQKAVIRIEGSAPSWKFFVLMDVTVVG